MFYRSEGRSACADVIPYYENGTYYLFYLRDLREPERMGEGCPWCLLTTKDFVHYLEHDEVLPRGPVGSQDRWVFTGSCIKANDEYYIFYTGHNHHLAEQGKPTQKLLLAKSKDLLHWAKDPSFALEAPEWLEMHDYRDPYVYYDEKDQIYRMLIMGRLKTEAPENTKGMTLMLTSSDLHNWDLHREPFYAPQAYYAHECPDLFKMGEWWYLVFSEFPDKCSTTYRMAKDPAGPWKTPKINTFDAHAFYAAKSASDGERRIMFGWNCTKEGARDDGTWQWGGNIIPHELVQDEDGTLYVRCPQEILDSYNVPATFNGGKQWNQVTALENGYSVGSNEGKSIVLLGDLPDKCLFETDFTVEDEIGDFGIMLRADELANQFYAIKFEPMYNRLALDRIPRKDPTVHFQADTERYCPIVPGQRNKLRVIIEESVLEVYVNDRVAMSARMYDYPKGKVGFYSHNTKAVFENVHLFV